MHLPRPSALARLGRELDENLAVMQIRRLADEVSMMGRPIILGAFGAAVSLLLMGCGTENVIDDSCFVDLAPISSRTNSATVGDTVTFKAALGPADCLPPGVDPPDWRWYSLDTQVVTIDSVSGLALARSPGLAAIHVEHARVRSVQSNGFLEVLAGP